MDRSASALLLLGVLLASGPARAATVTTADGKRIEGDVRGTLVMKTVSADGVDYTLLPGATVVAIAVKGVTVVQPEPSASRPPGPPAYIRLRVPGPTASAALTPKAELALLNAAASTDLKTQMDGLMSFRVTSGLGVDVAEDFAATSAEGTIYGVLTTGADALARKLTVATSAGEVSIAFPGAD